MSPLDLVGGTSPQRTFTQEIRRDKAKYKFLTDEIMMILSGITSLVIAVGCIVVIAITRGENCALNNGAFSILSAIAGGWLACIASVKKGKKGE